MTNQRFLFIDGSNLFGGFGDLLGPGQYFDFPDLLAVIEHDLPVATVQFYGTYMRVDPAKGEAYRLRVMAQKRFFDSAKNHPKVRFSKGHFSGSGKEKGVDVRLAVDMVLGAAQKDYTEAVIMTGDADLKYAVEKVEEHGLPVHLAALGSRFPVGIASAVQRSFVYDWDGFFSKHVLPNFRHHHERLIIRELSQSLSVKHI